MNTRTLVLTVALAALAARTAAAQGDTAAVAPIQDNSFLVEEAYNQEAGVVQHISNLVSDRGGDWAYSLTQEWPLAGVKHQISYQIPIVHAAGETGLGDVFVNYRYQWVGDADAVLAVSPRLSVIVPTASARKGFGSGAVGVQGAIPVSLVLVPNQLVSHSNVGVTRYTRAQDAGGNRAATTSMFLAQSAVWLVRPMFNLFVEGVWSRGQEVAGPGDTEWSTSAVISPGVRWGWNLPRGLQVVPGVAVPFGVGPSAGERSLFLYLSFEHSFRRQR